MTTAFDFTPLLPAGLPPPAVKYTGLPKYNFTGGNNDSDELPLDGLVAAADAVLKREGRTLATYGLASGPQGYRPLREFLVQNSSATPASPAPPTRSWSPRARCRRSIWSTARCSRAATPSSSSRTATRARSTGWSSSAST